MTVASVLRGFLIPDLKGGALTVYGNIRGLKPSQLKRLEKLYQRRIPTRDIVTQDFARILTEISYDIARQVGVLVNRKGQVEYVMVGDAHKILLPDIKRVRAGQGRLRGLRCIHTHLQGEELTQDDLTDLTLLRLDLMVAVEVGVDGLPGCLRAAYLVPQADGTVSLEHLARLSPSQLDVDFLQLISFLEDGFARTIGTAARTCKRERAVLVAINASDEAVEELCELACSSGVEVVDVIVQRRRELDPNYLIGKGKLEELLLRSMQRSADVVIFDRDLTPAQVRSISKATELKVIDRTQLIMDIFAQCASTSEGKIQVELAQLRYMLPRLSGHGDEMSRLMGGIGGRGPGETKLESDRRCVRERISALEKQLEKIRTARQIRRSRRLRNSIPVVSIVGYTNAGKSTLLNSLTFSDEVVAEKMFSTLDPRSRQLRLPCSQKVIVNDTVGFIKDLPQTLRAAFKATLEEIEESDLLVHLVDVSNPLYANHIRAVEQILVELGLQKLPRLLVFNKCDLVDKAVAENVCSRYGAVGISANDRKSLLPLVAEIERCLLSTVSYVQNERPWRMDGVTNG